MLPSEVSVVSALRDVGASVAAPLGPGAVLVLPPLRAMLLPAPVRLPAPLPTPAALAVPVLRFVPAALLGGILAVRRSAPTSARRLLRLGRRTLRRSAPASSALRLLRLRRRAVRCAAPSLPALLRCLMLRRRRASLLASPSLCLSALRIGRSAVAIAVRVGGSGHANNHEQRAQPRPPRR